MSGDNPATQPATLATLRMPLALASAALFLITAAFIMVKTGRDALYIQGDGLFGIPKAYIATAVIAIPQTAGMMLLLRRVGQRHTRIVVLLATLALIVVYALKAEPGASLAMTTFFFLVPLLFSVVFSMVWLLGTALLEDASKEVAAVAFSRLGAASILGGMAGGLMARTLGPRIGPRGLLVGGGVLLVCTLAAVLKTHTLLPPTQQPTHNDNFQGSNASLAGALMNRGVGLMLAIAMAASMAGILVDFQFYLAAVAGNTGDLTVYFANVYLVLSAASLALQLLVAPRLQKRIGVQRSLLVLPLAIFGGAALVLLLGTLLARAGLRVVEGGLKSGVHRTSWEQAYLQLPREDRASTKVLVDGLGARVAEGMAGLALHGLLWWIAFSGAELQTGWVAAVAAIWVTMALVITALTWALLSYRLGRRVARAGPVDPSDDELLHLRAPLPDS